MKGVKKVNLSSKTGKNSFKTTGLYYLKEPDKKLDNALYSTLVWIGLLR